MWLAGTRQVLGAIVASRVTGPGHPPVDAGTRTPGKPRLRDYTVQAPLRSRSGGNRFPEPQQASP